MHSSLMWNEIIASRVIGWSSIACWIIVYTPQFIESYTLKSGEGLSVYFVAIWLIGDLTNLLGAILAKLLPTIIILATYYFLCDAGLLFQIFYYRSTNPVHLVSSSGASNDPASNELLENSETSPLLGHRPQDRYENSASSDGHWWRHWQIRILLPYILGICFVLLIGGISYLVNAQSLDKDSPGSDNPRTSVDWLSQGLGWISAILYIGSRFPQIIKNFSTKCAGLSPVLFFFAMCGNITYTASILVASRDTTYLRINAPWLAGSGLIVLLDLFVLSQFIYFRNQRTAFVPNQTSSR